MSAQAEKVEAALRKLLLAQKGQPYRGWNITELNKAADEARTLLGMSAIREPAPDLAKMRDAFSAVRLRYNASLSAWAKETRNTILAVSKAFGAPGAYGYGTPAGQALKGLYDLYNSLLGVEGGLYDDPESLEARLADCLAAAIDTPLLTLRDPGSERYIFHRLGSFNVELAERAATLLEEAGK